MRLGLGISIPGTSGLVQAAFSPLDLSPVLWLDAADTSTITEVGGAVSQWDDKSGNGYDVTQGTAANQPTSGTRTLNSLNVLDFDGNDLLIKTTSPTLTQPNTVFFVAELDTTGANRTLLDGAGGAGRNIVRATSLNNWAIYAATFVTGGTSDTDPHIFRAVFDGASSSLHVDAVSTLTGDPGAQSLVGFAIGATYSATNGWDGAIAEVIIVDGTLTAGEIADTESYLANKWGITI